MKGKPKTQTCCSRACAAKSKQKPPKPKPAKRCRVCGKYLPKGRRSYCSDSCQYEGQKKRDREKNANVDRVCQWCGKTFRSKTKFGKYCGRECQAKGFAASYADGKIDRAKNNRTAVRLLVIREVPVLQSMRPRVGVVYDGFRCTPQQVEEPVYIIQGIGKYGLLVKAEEVREV